jgi:hypothetical protein
MHICSLRQRKRQSTKTYPSSIMEMSASSSSQTSQYRPGSICQGCTANRGRRHGVIKVCDEFPGFTRFKMHTPYGASAPKRISVPRSHAKHPIDTYPDASEVSIRKAVATFLPKFKNKELFNRALCWCTDTADAALLICEHPQWKNFILATGDSG